MKVIASFELPHALGSAAMHTVGGVENEAAVRLQVVQFDGETGHYRIRYGNFDQELTDTLHDNIAETLDQAGFECGADPTSWTLGL